MKVTKSYKYINNYSKYKWSKQVRRWLGFWKSRCILFKRHIPKASHGY